MNAFEFDHHLINSYERFSRSFSSIRSEDLRKEIDAQYDAGRFWPDALLSLNPQYEDSQTIDDLVTSGVLDDGTGKVFRFGESALTLRKHQAQSIAKAKSGKSFVVTTGTGSGKSLCFFVPIVDAIIRALRAGKPRTTRAIIVYPMNALANSQLKEIDKFISQSGLPDALKPVVKRYTGQESREERLKIAANPPDILLTNYMMAELLLTRQDELDSQVINNATGLEFIILDELHTYRGRQGADVAILVRRLRDRCAPDKAPICIGTSATMASEGSDESRAMAVAKVATRLFGSDIGPDAVIDESLQRATDDSIDLAQAKAGLAAILNQPLPDNLSDEVLKKHPLAVWAELALGLNDGLELKRKKPIPFEEAVMRLADDSGVEVGQCRTALEAFLTRVSLPEQERGGPGEGAFLAFKLHRFISGAGEVFTTLASLPRTVHFEGQLEDSDSPGDRLYPTRFCRSRGHEYHVVTKSDNDGQIKFLPRNIDDTPREADEDDDVAGYLYPIRETDPEFAFDGDQDSCPESWREERDGIERLRTYRKKRAPVPYVVGSDRRHGAGGKDFWFIPGKFAFCLCCQDEPNQCMRERSKLAGLSGEGRSSATTLLISSALEWMNHPKSGVPERKRKLLGFTDNRQDAALQSVNSNDFLFVSLLRGAILRAIVAAGDEGLTEDGFGLRVVKALGFTSANKDARAHWMLDPSSGAVIREDAQRALAKVLAHRVWTDLRRGWRYTNPSLFVLNLLDVEFVGLTDIASDRERLMTMLPELGELDHEQRAEVLKRVLGAMLEGLAVNTEALDLTVLDGVAQKSRSLLRSPWAIDAKENPRGRSSLLLRVPGKGVIGLREEQTLLRAGHNSRIARLINKKSVIGTKLGKKDYLEFFSRLLELLADEGVVAPVELDADLVGWRLTEVVALHRAIRMARDPEARVLLTTFNKTLAARLAEKLPLLSEHSVVARIDVAALAEKIEELYAQTVEPPWLASDDHVRGLLADAAAQHGVSLNPDFLWDEWSLVIDAWNIRDAERYLNLPRLGRKLRPAVSRREALWAVFADLREALAKEGLITRLGMAHALRTVGQLPYTHVVVDEAQDIAVAELMLLGDVLGQIPNGLFFAGDIGQRIFRAPFPWSAAGIELRGRSRSLKVNYRTSHQIRRQSDKLLPEKLVEADGSEDSRSGITSVFEGPPPVIQSFASRETDVEAVALRLKRVQEDGVPADQIAVLIRQPLMAVALRKALPGECTVLPMHDAKGSEFRAVAVIALDQDILSDQDRVVMAQDEAQLDEDLATERHLPYGAATSARDHLRLSGVEPLSEFLVDLTPH